MGGYRQTLWTVVWQLHRLSCCLLDLLVHRLQLIMFIAAPASAHLHILKPNERRLLKTNLLIFKQNLEHFFAFQIKCKLIYKFQRFNIFRKLTLFFFSFKTWMVCGRDVTWNCWFRKIHYCFSSLIEEIESSESLFRSELS